MLVFTLVLSVICVACLTHALLTLRYALSNEWKMIQRLKRYL